MRDINPEEIRLATLKYNDNPQKGTVGYYVHMEFVKPVILSDGEKPQGELCTLVHSTPEFAYQNFANIFSDPSLAEGVRKRTFIDACDFVY